MVANGNKKACITSSCSVVTGWQSLRDGQEGWQLTLCMSFILKDEAKTEEPPKVRPPPGADFGPTPGGRALLPKERQGRRPGGKFWTFKDKESADLAE